MQKPFLFAWLGTAAFYLCVDGVWLGLVAKDFYRSQLAGLVRGNVNLPVAAIFYVIYCGVLVFLASSNGVRNQSSPGALLADAAFGLAAYGTYDLTNFATLKKLARC